MPATVSCSQQQQKVEGGKRRKSFGPLEGFIIDDDEPIEIMSSSDDGDQDDGEMVPAPAQATNRGPRYFRGSERKPSSNLAKTQAKSRHGEEKEEEEKAGKGAAKSAGAAVVVQAGSSKENDGREYTDGDVSIAREVQGRSVAFRWWCVR